MTVELVGGFYTAIAPTLGDGQGYPLRLTSAGLLMVNAASVGPVAGADTPADARANPTTDVPTTAFLEAFNGTTWDRVRCGAVDASHTAPALGAIDARANLYGSINGAPTLVHRLICDSSGILYVYPAGASIVLNGLTASGGYVTAKAQTDRVLFGCPHPQNPSDTTGDPSLSNTYNDNAVTVKASAGWLLSAIVSNQGVAGVFQVFNKASEPVLGDVPVLSFPMASGAAAPVLLSIARDLLAGGKRFATGIAIGWSSTLETHTPAAFTGTANVLFS